MSPESTPPLGIPFSRLPHDGAWQPRPARLIPPPSTPAREPDWPATLVSLACLVVSILALLLMRFPL